MKKMLALMLVVSSTVVFAQRGRGGQHQPATVQQQLLLELNEHQRGQESIALKQEIKVRYPQVDIQSLKLDGVMLMAKSKMGKGEATLIVGQNAGYPVHVGGRPADFQVDSMRSFSRIQISAPSRDSEGKWQVETKGNVKIKAIIVLVTKKPMVAQVKTVVIPMNQEHSKGEDVLKLKQLIKKQSPHLDLEDMELQKVTLIAKSKAGNGRATLMVGQSSNYPVLIVGSPREFQSSAPRSFHQVELKNSGDSKGAWQIELKGNIKVKEMIVTLKGVGGASRGTQVPSRASTRSRRRN